MALTREGRELTEAHRVAQVKVRNRVEREVKQQTNLVDLDNISGSWSWKLNLMDITRQGHADSVALAADYMAEFPLAEIGESQQVVVPRFNHVATDLTIRSQGDAAIKKAIGAGVEPQAALLQAVPSLAGWLGQQAAAGGRLVVTDTVKYSGKYGRWRRVAGGVACAFCGMLAGRGPVYTADTVLFRSHKHCGCGAEQVFGDWQPTELEEQWRQAYEDAAKSADNAGESRTAPAEGSNAEDTILWRMRRQHPELFTDGVPGHELQRSGFEFNDQIKAKRK